MSFSGEIRTGAEMGTTTSGTVREDQLGIKACFDWVQKTQKMFLGRVPSTVREAELLASP